VSAIWITIVSLAVATAGLKILGPLLLGGRGLPVAALSVIELLAAALLAALIIVETFGQGRSLTLDDRAPGHARVLERAAEKSRILDRRSVVGEGDRTRGRELDQAVARMEQITTFLQQESHESSTWEETVSALVALVATEAAGAPSLF